jgi:hypothetical protein
MQKKREEVFMRQRTYKGGCLCGAIRYRAEGKAKDETNCHCTQCRRASGAPFVAWATFPMEKVHFEKEPRYFTSSQRAKRGFCPDCGTPLTFLLNNVPEEIDLTIASLDDPEDIVPKDHLWTQTQLSWIKLNDGLPVYRQRRTTVD